MKPANGPALYSAERSADVVAAASCLGEGGVVAIPTDTVYGLAASIFQPGAIERIFDIKQRESGRRVPILVASAADAGPFVEQMPRLAWALVEIFWPGPLTLVLPASRAAPRSITRGSNTIAVRVPAARSCLQLLQVLGAPVVGTSANVSGRPPAISADEAILQLGSDIDAVLEDDASIQTGVSSTVVELVDTSCTIHRAGAVSVADIRRVLGSRVQIRGALTNVLDGR